MTEARKVSDFEGYRSNSSNKLQTREENKMGKHGTYTHINGPFQSSPLMYLALFCYIEVNVLKKPACEPAFFGMRDPAIRLARCFLGYILYSFLSSEVTPTPTFFRI